jgi:hypothetical protein
MSEYQYYEFQAIDRPLTTQEQNEIRQLSSRVQVTPLQAVFLYNYGNFRSDPKKVLTQYFDMMFYIANWGTWQLIVRFPKAIVDSKWFEPYELPHTLTISTTSDYTILDIHITEENGMGWVEGEGWLSRLLPLRDDLLQGDLRLLYLVWLRSAPYLAGYSLKQDDPMEPPIPANLGQLSEPLQAFIELVELNPDLVSAAAAAQASPRQKPAAESPLEAQLAKLSAAEAQEFLLKLVRREPHVDLQLIQRLKELAGHAKLTPATIPGERRFSELEAISDGIRLKREQAAEKSAIKRRIRELEALEPKEAQTWNRVIELIGLKQSKPYDEATALLVDLRDLAEHQGRSPEFSRQDG